MPDCRCTRCLRKPAITPNRRIRAHATVCGVAMVGDKSQNDGKRYDIFRCLQCSTVIDLSGSGADTPNR